MTSSLRRVLACLVPAVALPLALSLVLPAPWSSAPAISIPEARAQAAAWKNLQVLPKNTSKAELKNIMKAQSKALGVECEFCHEMPNADAETTRKGIARKMMRMTNDLNKNPNWGLTSAPRPITCATCHRGKEKPEL